MSAMTWTLRITATERTASRVLVRRNMFPVSRPIEFDVESPGIAALEYFLGAVGAEIVGGLREFAKRRRIEVDAVEAIVNAEMENPLSYLEVIGESGQPRLTEIAVKIYISSPEDQETMYKLWDETLARLPLVSTLSAAVRLKIELTLTA